MAALKLRPAKPESLPLVSELLRQCNLPLSDLTATHMKDFMLAFQGDTLIGMAGIERAGEYGLLRSVAVLPAQRGLGVAHQLLAACEQRAVSLGLHSLVLIAVDAAAASYFSHHGYAPVMRTELPASLLRLPEFSHLCPNTKPCLHKIMSFNDAKNAIVTIYHNPACGTSRNTLAMIRNAGIEPVVIEYLKQPPDRATLIRLIADAGLTVRDALREKCEPYETLGLAKAKCSDDELIDFMIQHPILINRPFVVTARGTRLCRPSEVVLDILPTPQLRAFTKEDGEVVIDAEGNRAR